MISFNKSEIRELLTLENIFDLLAEWGGDPEYIDSGLLSSTICHNLPGEGSKKLYYYENTTLFHCYTGCPEGSFDIFELTIKVAEIQWSKKFDLNDAVRYIAAKFGIAGTIENDISELDDWKILNAYERIEDVDTATKEILLKEYDNSILERFNYKLQLTPWLKEGISQSALDVAKIGFFPGSDQITIPHFDKDGRLVGIRGRTVCAEDAQVYGKYRPLTVNKTQYRHPLGMNLYNLNLSKNNIGLIQKAIIFESEKSTLLYKSYFGNENDITVACCGSNISIYHIQLLLDAGAKEIIVAFDREGATDKKEDYVKKFYKINNKYKNFVNISFMYDKMGELLDFKSSPIDHGPEIFMKLFKNRITI